MAQPARTEDQATPQAEAPEKDSPLLDLSDAAVKRFIKTAKTRGYVTYDELNAVLPSEEVSSEQIEDTMSMLSDMGITVVESEDQEEAPAQPTARTPTRRREQSRRHRAAAAGRHADPRRADRAHRRPRAHVPARHGLRRAAVARGRDRHRQAHRGRPRGHDRRPVREPADLPGRHHLARRAQQRQDPAARHHRSGSDLRGPRGQGRAAHLPIPGGAAPSPGCAVPPAAPATAPTARASRAPRASDDEDDYENALSLAAMEAELKPKVLETFDNIAATYKKLRKLQDKKVEMQVASEQFNRSAAEGLRQAPRRDHRLRQEPVAQQQPHREPGRAALLHQQAPGGAGRPPDAAGRQLRRAAPAVHRRVLRQRAGPDLARPHADQRQQEVGAVHQARARSGRPDPHRDPHAGVRDGPRDHRVPPHRQGRAEGRARGAAGQEGDGGGQPAPRHLHRQEVHQPRPAVPGPDPGGQHRPDEGGRQVRVPPRLQVLDLRHLVDPAGHHPLDRRPGAHHPHPRAHDRDHQQDRAHRRARCCTRSAASRRRRSSPRSSPCRSRRCARS